MRLPVSLCGLLLSLGTLCAQGPTFALLGAPAAGAPPATDPFVAPEDRAWPNEVSHVGAFRRAVTARLTGHTLPDVVFLQGTEPVLMSAPGIHSHVGPLLPEGNLVEGAYDIAVLRGRGLDDGSHPALDALALVDDVGLWIWRRNPANGVASITQVPGTDWAAVRQLATHPGDPLVIFGIDDSGVIRVAEHTGNGYATSQVTFPILPEPLAIACVKYDSDNITDLAVVTKTGLTIFDRQGNTIVGEEQQTAASATLTLVRGGPQLDEECLVWLTPAASGGTELRLRSSTTCLDQPLYETFVGAAAADWSGDGNEEVLFFAEDSTKVRVCVNISNAQPIFCCHPATAFDIAIAAAGNRPPNRCPVATADFDADGDADLLAAIEPTSGLIPELRMVRSRLYDSPPIVTPVFVECFDNGDPTAMVTLSFTPGPGGTHTRLVLWKVDINDVLDPMFEWTNLIASGSEDNFVFPIDLNHIGNGGNYVFIVQPVNVVNGNVVEVAEASLSTFIVNQGGPGGTQVGGSTQVTPLPPPPPEDPPTPGG